MVYPIDGRALYVKSFYKTLFQRTPIDVAMSNWLTWNPACIIHDIRLEFNRKGVLIGGVIIYKVKETQLPANNEQIIRKILPK